MGLTPLSAWKAVNIKWSNPESPLWTTVPNVSIVLLLSRKFLFQEENRNELWFVPKHSLEKLSLGSRTCQSLLTASPFPLERSRAEHGAGLEHHRLLGSRITHTLLIHCMGQSHYRPALRCGLRNTSSVAENKAAWGGFTKAPWVKPGTVNRGQSTVYSGISCSKIKSRLGIERLKRTLVQIARFPKFSSSLQSCCS